MDSGKGLNCSFKWWYRHIFASTSSIALYCSLSYTLHSFLLFLFLFCLWLLTKSTLLDLSYCSSICCCNWGPVSWMMIFESSRTFWIVSGINRWLSTMTLKLFTVLGLIRMLLLQVMRGSSDGCTTVRVAQYFVLMRLWTSDYDRFFLKRRGSSSQAVMFYASYFDGVSIWL